MVSIGASKTCFMQKPLRAHRYNVRKRLERGAKGVLYNRHEISAVPPQEYRDRFIGFIDRSTE